MLHGLDERTGATQASIPVCGTPVHAAAGLGAVWVSCDHESVVQRVDPATNRVTATISATPDARLDPLAVHGGAVWVVGDSDNRVYRIDPAKLAVVAALTLDSEPRNLAFADGDLWVAGFAAGQVFRIHLP